MQRQPRWALTLAMMMAALCCASSAKAPSTLSTSVAGASGASRIPGTNSASALAPRRKGFIVASAVGKANGMDRNVGPRELEAKRDEIVARTLRWWDRNRRTLAWRAGPGETPDPYRVWL